MVRLGWGKSFDASLTVAEKNSLQPSALLKHPSFKKLTASGRLLCGWTWPLTSMWKRVKKNQLPFQSQKASSNFLHLFSILKACEQCGSVHCLCSFAAELFTLCACISLHLVYCLSEQFPFSLWSKAKRKKSNIQTIYFQANWLRMYSFVKVYAVI